MSPTGTTSAILLSTPVRDLPGVGAARARLLSRLGLATAADLLRHLPLRYEKEYAEGAISDLPMDGIGTARGTVVASRWVGAPVGTRGRFQATLQDHSARLDLTWFNAPWLRDKLHPGMVIRVQGKVKAYRGYAQMANPKWEPLTDPAQSPARSDRIRPVYPVTEDLPGAVLERLVQAVLPDLLPQVVDPLPGDLLRHHNMPGLAEAFRMAHQPADADEAGAARRRLAFNEFLLIQLGIALKRHHTRTHLAAPALRWSPAVDQHIKARFPFQLTPEQQRVIGEIAADLAQGRPMNRLLQGDVGSGKTVVALYALLLAVAARRQGAIMTPTELLAEQHYASITAMLEGANVRVALLTGGLPAAERRILLGDIEQGRVDLLIGTQALLTETVRFSDLAVVVIDEQHRFGVMQRAQFRGKSGPAAGGDAAQTPAATALPTPHCLVMTATPIPRSLSLTVFGDLDISTLTGLPPGRSPIATRVVGPEKADEVYGYAAGRVAAGEQAYVVVPTIDAGGRETAAQLKNVRDHADLLARKWFAGQPVAAIHGRLKRQTREAIMHRFRQGQVKVLVATTVIEVGVDVPAATLMVVEHAERFGLAQLHQLRGRIGRSAGGPRSLCVFIAEAATDEARRRMQAIAATADGFKIAEADLEIRGMGDFFGTRQHGLPPLRVARIPEDMDLLQLARRDAHDIVQRDPALADPARALLRRVLIQHYGDALGLVDVG